MHMDQRRAPLGSISYILHAPENICLEDLDHEVGTDDLLHDIYYISKCGVCTLCLHHPVVVGWFCERCGKTTSTHHNKPCRRQGRPIPTNVPYRRIQEGEAVGDGTGPLHVVPCFTQARESLLAPRRPVAQFLLHLNIKTWLNGSERSSGISVVVFLLRLDYWI